MTITSYEDYMGEEMMLGPLCPQCEDFNTKIVTRSQDRNFCRCKLCGHEWNYEVEEE